MRTTDTNSIARSFRLSPGALICATGLAATLAFATPAARADFIFSGFATSASWHDDDFGFRLGFSNGARYYDRGWAHNAWRSWHGHYDRVWWRPSYYRSAYWYVAPIAPVIIESRYAWIWDGYGYRWRIVDECGPASVIIADGYCAPVVVLGPTPYYRDSWYYSPRTIVTYTSHYRPYGWYGDDCYPYSRSRISTSFIYSSNDWYDDGDRFSFAITIGNSFPFRHRSGYYSPFTHHSGSYRDRAPIFVNQPNIVINNPTIIVNNNSNNNNTNNTNTPAPLGGLDKGPSLALNELGGRDSVSPQIKGQTDIPSGELTSAPNSPSDRSGITANPSRRAGGEATLQPSRSPDRARAQGDAKPPRNEIPLVANDQRPTTIADHTSRVGDTIDTPEIRGSRADTAPRKPSAILPAMPARTRSGEPELFGLPEAKPQTTPDAGTKVLTPNTPRRAIAPAVKADLNPSNTPAAAPNKPLQVIDSRDLGRRGVSGPSVTSLTPSTKPEARPNDTLSPMPSRAPRAFTTTPSNADIKTRPIAPAFQPHNKVAPQNVPLRTMTPSTSSTPMPNVTRRPMPTITPSIEVPVISQTPKAEAEARRSVTIPTVVSPRPNSAPSPNSIAVPRNARPADSGAPSPGLITSNGQRGPRIVSPSIVSPRIPSQPAASSPGPRAPINPMIMPSRDDSDSPSRSFSPRNDSPRTPSIVSPSRTPKAEPNELAPRPSRNQGRAPSIKPAPANGPSPSMGPAPSPNATRTPSAAPARSAPAPAPSRQASPAAAPAPAARAPEASPAPSKESREPGDSGRKG